MRWKRYHPRPERRGSAIVAVVVCLVAITTICGALLRVGLEERRILRGEEHRLQAEWLAESGMARAVARLAESDDYDGETWEIPANALGGASPGLVKIVVTDVKSEPRHRLVTVQADYPSGTDRRSRQSHQLIVERASQTEGEAP